MQNLLILESMMASSFDAEKWKDLLSKAKALTNKGQLEESLVIYRQALAIRHHDKLVDRIKKIEVKQFSYRRRIVSISSVAGIRCDWGTKRDINENNLLLKNDTKYINHVAITELQQLLSQTVKFWKDLSIQS